MLLKLEKKKKSGKLDKEHSKKWLVNTVPGINMHLDLIDTFQKYVNMTGDNMLLYG